jgi:alpha,alpha-trehalase
MSGQNTKLQNHDVQATLDYVNSHWETLQRKNPKDNATLIGLPHPYIVPGTAQGNFSFDEQYYWDSYFIALGIDDEKLVTGMLENLIYLFETFGLIPNANRYYFTSRSQPPILTTFIFHVYDKYNKPKEWLKKHIQVAQKEYNSVWTSKDHPHARQVYEGLSRYYDINCMHDLAEAESGWDMTPRFKRQCLDYIPIDLNCLLYKYEIDFARAARILGDTPEERVWQYAAEQRRDAVTKLLWNKRQGFFFDYNYIDKEQSKVWSLAAYYALWSGLANAEQAKSLIKRLERFEKKGGLTTTIGNYMYFSLFGSAKAQWAYPNGWAPLHFIVTEGLELYNQGPKASDIAHTWLKTCNDWYLYHGELQEKYNVVNPGLKPADGLYPSQTGFG